jgi:hypothetical protein
MPEHAAAGPHGMLNGFGLRVTRGAVAVVHTITQLAV